MSGLISISSSGGGSNNASNIIVKDLKVDGKIESNNFSITYIVEKFKTINLKHFIYINGQKKEITKEVLYENSKNEFKYKLNDLIGGTIYNIQIEVSDSITTSNSDVLKVTTSESIIYGVTVDIKNNNPSSSVTYIYNAINVQQANKSNLGGWKDKFPFNKIKIVGMKNGIETKEINPTNRTQYIDGSFAPLDVDIMVKIPKTYWSFKNTDNGYEVRISNIKVDSTYDCYAHKVNGIEKDYIYVGAYLGSVENGKLRSTNNVSPSANAKISQFRQYAQANGEGYQQLNYNTLMLLQILYLILYKNLNCQSALGMGYTETTSKTTTGGTNRKDLCYGSVDGSIQMCFLGIEDLWGNMYEFVDGILTDSSLNILVNKNNRNFNDTGEGYKNIGSTSLTGGNISEVIHTNDGGFFPTKFIGSSTTYYCDYGYNHGDHIYISGGHFGYRFNAGIFCLNGAYSKNESAEHIGSRLCYLG